jgi:hypothetical protein
MEKQPQEQDGGNGRNEESKAVEDHAPRKELIDCGVCDRRVTNASLARHRRSSTCRGRTRAKISEEVYHFLTRENQKLDEATGKVQDGDYQNEHMAEHKMTLLTMDVAEKLTDCFNYAKEHENAKIMMNRQCAHTMLTERHKAIAEAKNGYRRLMVVQDLTPR